MVAVVGKQVPDTGEDGDGPLDESEHGARAQPGVERELVQRGKADIDVGVPEAEAQVRRIGIDRLSGGLLVGYSRLLSATASSPHGAWTHTAEAKGDHVARSWFIGANPVLHEPTPLAAIRNDRGEDLMLVVKVPPRGHARQQTRDRHSPTDHPARCRHRPASAARDPSG